MRNKAQLTLLFAFIFLTAGSTDTLSQITAARIDSASPNVAAETSLATPGDLDPTFGSGGIVVTSFTNTQYSDFPRSIQVQPDGKIVVCGRINQYDPDSDDQITVSFFLARYNPDGTLDTSFGTNGKIVAPINSGDELVGEKIALQPDGKIVAVGYRLNSSSGVYFAVNRYNSDGTLDASFGTGGKVITQMGDNACSAIGGDSCVRGVAVQPDGKIVIVGFVRLLSFNSNFAVVRYNPNGTLDTGFGEGGKVITPLLVYSRAEAVMIQPNGKIVVAGSTDVGGGGYSGRFALVRYNADGSLDSGFGVGGIVIQTFPIASAYLTDAVLQPDGRIVVVGHLLSPNTPAMAIVRYKADGSVDTSFAVNGVFTSPNTVFLGPSIAVQADGKIVSFGSYYYARSAALRLNPNGSPDAGFGSNGVASTNFANGTSYGLAGAIQPNGKILFLGYTWTGGDIIVARLLGNQVRSNGRIAFTSDRDGNLEIYVMNNDGTQQVRLTNNTDTDCLPAVSPDGRKIAFVSKQTTSGTVYIKIMNADGAEQTELTQISSSFYLSTFPWHEYRSLSWSPDGRKIAFDSEDEIFTINVDGSNRINLTNNPARDVAPAWSPDGSRILFVSNRNGGLSRLHTMNADGSDVRALPSVVGLVDYSPEWSPAGNQIAFVVGSEDFLPILYTADADGTNRQIFDGNGFGSLHRNRPKWSPDGTKIVFHIWNFIGDDCEIYVKSVNGGGAAQLTNTIGHNFQPTWQPLAPFVSVSGRVTRPGGQGLSNAVVSMTDSLGVTRTATASTFGYYSFDNVPIGETYTIFVASRRYRFLPRTLTIADNLTDIDFAGQE